MNTFKQFFRKPETIPASTVWYSADLSEARGKQGLNVLPTGRELNGGKRVIKGCDTALTSRGFATQCVVKTKVRSPLRRK